MPAKIKAKHPGLLEVPEGKHFWQLPVSHYERLVKKHGYAKVVRALINLYVWNKRSNPDISKKAYELYKKLKKAVKGSEKK